MANSTKYNSQTLNEEIGGDWQNMVGGEVKARDSTTGPNAGAVARITKNKIGASAELGAEANAFDFHQPSSGAKIKAFGARVGANAEAGLGGVGASYEARLRLADAEGAGFGVKLGAGISSGVSVGLGGVQAKVAGCGLSVGKKIGVSALDNEFYVDIAKMFGFLTKKR
jgi:hypothetical protein